MIWLVVAASNNEAIAAAGSMILKETHISCHSKEKTQLATSVARLKAAYVMGCAKHPAVLLRRY